MALARPVTPAEPARPAAEPEDLAAELEHALGAGAVRRDVSLAAFTTYQLGGQFRKPIVLTVCPAILNQNILTFDIADLTQAFAKRRQIDRGRCWRTVD